ncbi:MAG: hypothetical protein K6F89_00345 [Prevotella sp.]|nr:hypothetical protein [Prevotella sp.]
MINKKQLLPLHLNCLKCLDMMFPKEFENLINEAKDNYSGEFIGVGNPASNILIIGKEPAIPKEKENQRKLEIESNYKQWKTNIKNGNGFDKVPSMNEKGYEYNPLYPYRGQKFLVYAENSKTSVRGEGGTSRTWYQYQKLWDFIRFNKENRHPETIDYHEHCFSTELSTTSEKYSSLVNPESRLNSIANRKGLLSHTFYQRFPIVILAVGHYPKKHSIDIEKLFQTRWNQQTYVVGKNWYNIHYSATDTPKILVHTNQLSMVSDELLKEIANRCIGFKDEYSIEL